MLDRSDIDEALRVTGALLERRGARHTIVVIGGAAMLRLDLDRRPTIDVDVVALQDGPVLTPGDPLPDDVVAAAAAVARTHDLPEGWLNAESAADFAADLPLPQGMIERCTVERYGGLVVLYASRHDLVAFKLLAAVENFERGARSERHRHDLRLIGPRPDELRDALRWFRQMTSEASASHRMCAELLEEEDWHEHA